MIKQTFYNLPEDKRNELLKIAKKEFSTKPIHEATVATIVAEYGIARSSFYNYFDNIEDLFYYILIEFREKIKLKIVSSIQFHKGDIFEAFIDTFDYLIGSDINKIDLGIMKNVFLNSSNTAQRVVMPMPNKDEIEEGIKILSLILDKSNLKISSDKELLLLIEILMDNMFQSIIHFFMVDTDVEMIKQNFKNKIEIIKYGICKEKK